MRFGEKSDGNPFFAFEIIRGLREGQFITQRSDGTWATTRMIEEIQIPSSVLDLVNARVAELTDDERNLLDVAACLGFEFDPSLVGSVLGMGRIPTLQAFGRIEKRHRLARSAGRCYAFDHHQVQEALYNALNEQLREAYHAALAEAIEAREEADEKDPGDLDGAVCVDLCEHSLRGARRDRAIRYLPAALDHLESGYLSAQASTLAGRALGVPGLVSGEERVELLLRQAGLLDMLGRRDAEGAVLDEALALAAETGDDMHITRVELSRGWFLLQIARHDEALETLLRAAERARTGGDADLERLAAGSLGSAMSRQGSLTEAEQHYERALEISRAVGNRRAEGGVTSNLGLVLHAQGRLADAKEHYERALAIHREVGNRYFESITLGNLGNLLRVQGHFAEARQFHERGLVLAREIGYRSGEASAAHNLGSDLAALGRPAEARKHYEQALALAGETGQRLGEAITFHNLGVGLRDAGEYVACEMQLLTCLAFAQEIGAHDLIASTNLQLGSVRAAMGNPEGARAALASACDLATKWDLPGVEVLARCELALLHAGDVVPCDGADAAAALAAFTEQASRLGAQDPLEARLLLHRATGDRAHIEEAKRLLDDLLARNPPEFHETMRTDVRVNREVLAAWREAFE